MTPVVSDVLVLHIIVIVGASCSLCSHCKKIPEERIAAKDWNRCTPRRTRFRFYPEVYPQKLRIISIGCPLRNQRKIKI